MFIGHFGLAFAARRAAPGVSLAILFLAAQFADTLWPFLVAAGVEQVRIDPGHTAVTPLDFVSYPWSHSLLMLAVWGVLLGWMFRTVDRRAFAVIAALVVSHWVLDFVTHVPDMPVHATLTDLFPNIPTFEAIANSSDGRITFEPAPVDARAVPAALRGLRTIFNGFHHFTPSDARSVLHAAAAASQPIAIFEASDRRAINLLGVLLVPFAVWLMTPFIRPFRWSRLLLTYLLPLVPLTCLWDGVVSQLRAYTADEMLELGRGAPRMRWETGHIPIARGRGRVTYLLGIPC